MMSSEEEKYRVARDRRSLNALNTLYDLSFGTLWWVKNELWRQTISNFDLAHPDGSHPGISLGRKNNTSLFQMIPMLLGSHAHKHGFAVKGVTEKEENLYSFFNVRPQMFHVKNALGKDPGFVVNSFKRHLSEQEEYALRQYLSKKGVRFDEV